MEQTDKKRWKKLCEQVAVEHDPHKFINLVKEVNDILAEKERLLIAAHAKEREAHIKKEHSI